MEIVALSDYFVQRPNIVPTFAERENSEREN